MRLGLTYPYRPFNVAASSSEQVAIFGLTLTRGDAHGPLPDGGAIHSTDADLTIRDSVITATRRREAAA